MFRRAQFGIAATVCALVLTAVPAAGRELRVCADPHALPPSRDDSKRLDAARCDVSFGTTVNPDALQHAPMDRSAYVFVYRPRRLRHLPTVDVPRMRSLKIGVAHGAVPTLPAHTLVRRGIIAHVVDVSFRGDRIVPERMIAALAAGTLDVATLWGQRSGGFTRPAHGPLALTTVAADVDLSSRFDARGATCRSADPPPPSFASYAQFRLCR